MKNLKASIFNVYIELPNGEWLIYNNLSCAMLEIQENIYKALFENKTDTLPKHYIDLLRQTKFLVDKSKNEILDFRKKKSEIQYNVEVIGLQILPTMACNFCCYYCFEKTAGSGKRMSKKVMQDIISWIRNEVRPTTKVLNVMWFGGEPLLAIEQIDFLSKAFLALTEKNQIKYYSNIITNGYLLTEKNIDILLENKVSSCMVTIDGPEEIHDKRRVLRNGGKTLQVIANNVKKAIEKGISVTIRVNIDKSNCDYIDMFFFSIIRDVSFYFGEIYYEEK